MRTTKIACLLLLNMIPAILFGQSSFTPEPLPKDFYQYLHPTVSNIYKSYGGENNWIESADIIPLPYTLNFKNVDEAQITHYKSGNLPSRFDLRELNKITSVKNQSSSAGLDNNFGGNCWAFSTMGAIESQRLMLGMDSVDLSEHHMVTCSGFEWGYGEGGNDLLAMAYLTRLAGPLLETDVPYTPDNKSTHTCIKSISPYALVPETRWLPNNKDIIKKALMKYGAISTGMRWHPDSYRKSDKTFFYSGNGPLNHAIVIVGWDDNISTIVGKGAWICKNQWGTSFGDEGYFYVSYLDGAINKTASYYPMQNKLSSIDKLYMYDELSATRYVGAKKESAYALTKFTTSKAEKITMVGTFVNTAGAFIDIEIYQAKIFDTLSNLIAKREKLYCELPGYYTFDIPAEVNGDFYVKLMYQTPENFTPIPVEKMIDSFAMPNIHSASGIAVKNYQIQFKTTADVSKPEIASSNISDNTTGVDTNISIRLTINQDIFNANVNQIKLLDNNNDTVLGLDPMWFAASNKLQINHAGLLSSTNYKLIIPQNSFINPSMIGNDATTLSFTTINPNELNIDSIKPSNNSNKIALNAKIEIFFHEAIDTILKDKIKLRTISGDSVAISSISLSNDNKKATITAFANKYNTTYQTIINDSAFIALSGKPMQYRAWNFTTIKDRPKVEAYFPQLTFHQAFDSVELTAKFDQDIYMTGDTSITFRNKEAKNIYNINYIIKWNNSTNTFSIKIPKVTEDTVNVIIPAGYFKNEEGSANRAFYWTISKDSANTFFPMSNSLQNDLQYSNTDTSIKIFFNRPFELNPATPIVLTSALKTNVEFSTQIISQNCLEIKPLNIKKDSVYTLSLPLKSLQTTDGINWISSDGSTWIGVGEGQAGYEYDLCIRAYTDTGSAPTPSFIANKTKSCISSPVRFTDQSIGDITNYTWDFGDTIIYGKGPHDVTFNSTGLKHIKLTVEGANGKDSLIKYNYLFVDYDINIITSTSKIEIPKDSTARINIMGVDSYTWFPTFGIDSVAENFIIFRGLAIGTYTYHIYGNQGLCTTHDSIIVVVTGGPKNDNVCNATELFLGKNGTFSNEKATVEQNEPHPINNNCLSQNAWCYEYNGIILNNSIWFKYVATQSGIAAFSTNDFYGTGLKMDNQIAVYKADNCNSLLNGNYSLLAANDDYYNESEGFAAKVFVQNLTPGETYWIQVDGSAGGVSGSFYITVTEELVISTNPLENNEFSVKISPNPTNGVFKISMPAIDSYTIFIKDLQGKVIYETTQNSTEPTINISHSPNGVYIINIVSKEKHYVGKIVKY